ncbi:cyclase family protein [Jiangella ureilytica]|uniref:Cyclase family protein n=1 Tax=Jiangella ureilytica TaxID=2530374 RepID=A0A4V2XXD6_9ACTN|nr:cyclase family protein [Jiangella ureilytica]TDC52775.1 cyclase family protein [Jiangella ureilytica]
MNETPSDAELCGWFDSLSNWGRWGDDDECGTLNLIDEDKRTQAAGLVRRGVAISCAQAITFSADSDDPWPASRRFMNKVPQAEAFSPDFVGRSSANDAVLLNCHGSSITHLDSPVHSFFRPAPGRPMAGYNGLAPTVVTGREGARAGSIALAASGVVSRGVLLDIPRARGLDWLAPSEKVFPADLEAAEAAQGVRVEAGDILCIRTGHPGRRRAEGWQSTAGQQAGPDGACLPWLRERDVALLACDTACDVFPPDKGHMARPIHCIGIPAMGLWLLDGADYEELAAACAAEPRWEFQFTVAPLRLEGCTASPVNPIAVL